MANKVAFINGKGGCGKTTSIFHVSGVLSKMGEKVLVIDFDKQRNSTTTLLMNNENRPSKTALDFLRGEAEAHEVTAQALFQTRGNAKPKYYGVDCMVSDKRFEDEANLADIDGEEAGRKLKAFIEERGYTWVLVDMPPSNLTLNNICFRNIVDNAIIPFSSDTFSVDGYADIMEVLDNAREVNPLMGVLGVYFSNYEESGMEEYLRERLLGSEMFIDIQIPHLIDVREAVMFGRPISYYKLFSKSKTAYEKLVNEMIQRMK